MAILYGTMQNGQLVAVEADSQGRLVAQLANPVDPSNFVPVTGGTMTGNLTVPSLNGGQLAGFRNQIINGDFRVWQRGTSFPNFSLGYFADRWFTNAGANSRTYNHLTNPLDGFSFGIRCTGNGTQPSLSTPVELPATGAAGLFVGTWTLSFWTNNTDVDTSLFFSDPTATPGNYGINTKVGALETIETRAGFTRLKQTYSLVSPNPTNTNLLTSIFGNTSGSTFQITGVQFEPGPVATEFEHRPIGTELALCQRYYQIGGFGWTFATNLNTSFITGNGIFSVEMRAAPTLKEQTTQLSLLGATAASDVNTTNGSIVQAVFNSRGSSRLRLGTLVDPVAASSTYSLNTSGKFGFDAEL